MVLRRDYRPVTEEDFNAVRDLHAQGFGRNEIARQINRAQRTVSLIAQELGLEFDVTMTEVATRHRIAQLEEKRTILAEALTDDALKLTEQLWQPAKVFNIGGKDNVYTEQEVPEPPADAKRALMAAAVAAANQSVRLVPPKDTDGAEEVGSLLTSLFDRLRDRHGDG
ncbi:helix-turn-helix domain-containing protein [Streptomyces sp. NPDC002659]|uniref:helix-turn-helix domain-containing protein n=1 Tax=Streptomyces sp. NPDC002659 TaxID=3364656 RepID=UPI0036B7AD86